MNLLILQNSEFDIHHSLFFNVIIEHRSTIFEVFDFMPLLHNSAFGVPCSSFIEFRKMTTE